MPAELRGLKPARTAHSVWRDVAPKPWQRYANRLVGQTLGSAAAAGAAAALAAAILARVAFSRYRRRHKPSHWRRHLAEDPEQGPIPMSPCERGLWLAAARHRGALTVLLALQLEGPAPTSGAWQAALRRLEERHPLLGCVVARSVGGQLFFQRRAGSARVRRVARGGDSEAWRGAWRELAAAPAAELAPLCEVVVLEDGGGAYEVVIAASHAIADGRSLLALADELLRLVSGSRERLPRLPAPMSVEAAARAHLGALGGLRKWAAVARLAWRMWREPEPARVALTGSEASHCAAEVVSVDAAALRAACKREGGVSVTAAVAAALLAAVSPGAQGNCTVAVDLRARLAEALRAQCRGLAFCVSGVALPCVSPAAGLWPTARAVHGHLRAALARDEPGAMAPLVAAALSAPQDGPLAVTADVPSCDVSNWGVAPLRPAYGRIGVRGAVAGYNGARFPAVGVVAVTVNGRLTLTVQAPVPAIGAGEVEGVAQSLGRALGGV